MKDEIKLLDEAFQNIRAMNHIWRFNWSLGFRNGDVHESNWEDEQLLIPSKEELIVKKWAKENRFDYLSYKPQIEDLIERLKRGEI